MVGMKIGICDDEKDVVFQLKAYVEKYQTEKKCACEIEVFSSGEELLLCAQEYAVVFLDIEMDGLDGIKTGELLRRKNPDIIIIMATGRQERYKEAFRIQAFRFITKPFEEEEIYEALDAVSDCQCGEEEIELFSKRAAIRVKQREICYIRACYGDTEFLVGDQVFRKEISLNDLENVLDQKMFVRVHRQYIVNMGWIETYQDGRISIGGQCITVARRKRKEFERKYIEYDIQYRGN